MRLRRYIDGMERESVVVHTKTGSSISGVLISVHRDCVVLRHAKLLSASGSVVIDGEAIVPRAEVEWIQRPGDAS